MPTFEDEARDVVAKAIRGLKINASSLCDQTGVNAEQLDRQLKGDYNEAALLKLAPALQLHGPSLVNLALGRTQPGSFSHPQLRIVPSPYHDMVVNSYLLVSPQGDRAVLFDAGTDAAAILKENLGIDHIFLTHTHPDHILALGDLAGPPVHANSQENVPGGIGFEPGETFSWEGLTIETRLTWGHAVAGTTYVIHGVTPRIAVVGDALFARSMGGGMVSYTDALTTNRKEIFSLPPDTLIASGHGPLTTVGVEAAENPFFAF